MNAIPWYKSPVYIGIVVNLVYGAFNMLGMADLVSLEDINLYVANGFGLIAFVAIIVAEWKRRRSTVQPIALTKASAQKQSGYARADLLFVITVLILSLALAVHRLM